MEIEIQLEEIQKNIGLIQKKIEPIVKESGVSEKELLIEMIKFLNIVGSSKQLLSPSKYVDLVWHEFILFTKFYHTFCAKYYQRYIHHSPSEKSDSTLYRKTIRYYILQFGKPPKEVWGEYAYNEWKTSNCGACTN